MPNGTVPDIVFEQLPFNQPLNMNFTSGTTGLPKAAIHSAGVSLQNASQIYCLIILYVLGIVEKYLCIYQHNKC